MMLQEQLLKVIGSAVRLQDPSADLTKEDIIIQLQRALCIVGRKSTQRMQRQESWINSLLAPLAKYEKW